MTFEEDQLNLRQFCDDLEKFLLTDHQFMNESLVISLNAPFGSGKSTFLEMWDLVLLLESNSSDKVTDVTEGIGRKGVQLLSFSEVVHSYKGRMAIRQIVFDGDDPGKEEINRKMADFRQQHRNKPYEKKCWEMIFIPFSVFHFIFIKRDKRSYFCSELIVDALDYLGFKDLKDRLAETFSPKNFQGDCHPPLPLKAGIKYGEEIEL